eukprot:3663412-Prymnesium_polylepis.1
MRARRRARASTSGAATRRRSGCGSPRCARSWRSCRSGRPPRAGRGASRRRRSWRRAPQLLVELQ